jgi:hypothetical protein
LSASSVTKQRWRWLRRCATRRGRQAVLQAEQLLTVLCKADVAFVIIRGMAAVVQGSSYVTADLDICYQRQPQRRRPHPDITGKGRTLGDLVSPIVDDKDWECLK